MFYLRRLFKFLSLRVRVTKESIIQVRQQIKQSYNGQMLNLKPSKVKATKTRNFEKLLSYFVELEETSRLLYVVKIVLYYLQIEALPVGAANF